MLLFRQLNPHRNRILRTAEKSCRKICIMGVVNSKKKQTECESSIEKTVCQVDSLKDGEMKEFDLGEGKVLLVKENGQYSALGTKCTHYGAPLVSGVLRDGKIRCPWHGACFNATTGDIEDYPGLDSLPCFEVAIVNDDVKVKAKLSALKNAKRVKPFVKHLATNLTTCVVIGGGAAAQTCVETLRQNGYTGKLIMITKEKHIPYDRPKLSKALDSIAKNLYLRDCDYYKNADVTMMFETEVTGIDTEQHWVKCDDGKLMVKYDSLVIATGGSPIMLDVPGCTLKNIYTLRTPEDGNDIAEAAVGKAVIVIGSSFIGMEVVSFLLTKARSINVLCRSNVPFKAVFGEVIGMRIKQMFEEKGVVFHAQSEVKQFLGNKGSVTGVELLSGEVLDADLCVVGIGVKPSTEFLKDTAIDLNSKGLVSVDEFMKTNITNVFACGDIVEMPLSVFDGIKTNISHWQMAMAHGKTAALNILGKEHQLRSVPFFWCVLIRKSFRYTGLGGSFNDVVIKGNVDNLEFAAYYCKDDDVVAVCTVNKDPIASSFASQLLTGNLMKKSDICEL